MKYYIPIAKKPEDEYYDKSKFFKSTLELFNFWNCTSLNIDFDLAEVRPINLKIGALKGNYTILKIFSLKDLIKEYKKTKKVELFVLILKHKDLTDKDIFSILGELDLENPLAWEELIELSKSSEISEEVIIKIIEIINLVESYKKCDVLIRLVENHKITEPLLKNIIETTKQNEDLNKYEKTDILSHVAKKSNISQKFLKEMFEMIKYCSDIVYYKVFSDIINNSETDSELIDEIVVFLKEHCPMNDGESELVCEIAGNPKTLLKSLKKIFYINARFRSSVAINIVNNPNTDEEFLKLIAQNYDYINVLVAIIKSSKVTSDILNYIICKLKRICLKNESKPDRILSLIIKSFAFNEELLEILINNFTMDEIEIIGQSEILNQSIINKLYKKVQETSDLELFEKLLYLEKVVIGRICEDNTCDNKLNFRKEYLKVLNRYLESDILEIRIRVFKVMVKEGYLKKEDIVDKEYIKECPRTLKLCSLLYKI